MEKYIKLSDVFAVIKRLQEEPEYWHEGETFYAGVYSVESEIVDLPTYEIKEGLQSKPNAKHYKIQKH